MDRGTVRVLDSLDVESNLEEQFEVGMAAVGLPEAPLALSLDRLPYDVLIQIWEQLDSPTDFVLVNRHFHHISKVPHFRARWFLHKYPPYLVIFEAIARSKIFTRELFQILMAGGAVLSRNLVQLLRALHKPVTVTGQTHTKWGSSLVADAVIAVFEQSQKLYGRISLHKLDLESLPFRSFVLSHNNSEGLSLISKLLSDSSFLPLPLSFTSKRAKSKIISRHLVEQTPHVDWLRWLLIKFPQFAKLVYANGYRINAEDSNSICYDFFIKARTHAATTSFLRNQLHPLLQARVVIITPTIASAIICSMRFKPHFDVKSPLVKSYDVLTQLDRLGSLDFALEEVVAKVLDGWNAGVVKKDISEVLLMLKSDFPGVRVSSLLVRSKFAEAERKDSSLAAINASMALMQVTLDDLKQATLYSSSHSTLAFQYAVQYFEGLDLASFVSDILDTMLQRPGVKTLLLDLDNLFNGPDQEIRDETVNFRQLLAAAVESQAFRSAQVPPQEWTSYGCNIVPPIRSAMTFGCSNFARIDAWPPHGATVTGASTERFLQGFTRFLRFGSVPHAEQTESSSMSYPICIFQGLDDLEYAQHGQLKVRRPTKEELYAEFCGFNPADQSACTSIAYGIVQLLGGPSKATDVALSHAFVNGNRDVVGEILAVKGSMLTLEHIKIGLKVGYGLPTYTLKTHISSGAPFKASFETPDDQPDSDLLRQKPPGATAKLTVEETKLCLEARGTNDLFIYVEVDSSGLLNVSTSADGRIHVAETIVTQAPASSIDGFSCPPTSSSSAVDNDSEENSRRRIRSLELWQAHLEVLYYHEKRKVEAVAVCLDEDAQSWHGAHLNLEDILKHLADTLSSLRQALPAEAEEHSSHSAVSPSEGVEEKNDSADVPSGLVTQAYAGDNGDSDNDSGSSDDCEPAPKRRKTSRHL